MKLPPPDLRDLHIYGGLTLAAAAGFMSIGWAAIAVCGLCLAYLGIWRMS